MSGTRQVQVPHSQPQKEKVKSEYSDWRWAMISEFTIFTRVQTAPDAPLLHRLALRSELITLKNVGAVDPFDQELSHH